MMADSSNALPVKISIGDLLQKTAVLIYKELENVRFSLKSADPEMRTITLRSFVQRTMKKLTQVYAIVEWCRHPETVLFFKTIENLTQQIRELEANMNLGTDRFFYMHAGLHGMRTLRDNVELAQDIVVTGTYRYLPEAIFTCGDVNQPGKKRVEDIDKDAMIDDLNMYIRIRLFQYDPLPATLIDYSKIIGGYLILRRNDLYEVIVSLDHLSPRSQWVILHARVLVKNHELEYYDGTYDNNALGMDLLGILRKHALAAREAFQLEEQKKVDAEKDAKNALLQANEAAVKHEERFNTIMDKYRLPFLKEVLDQAQGKKGIIYEENEMDVVDIKAEKHDGSLDNTSVSGTTDGIDTKKKKSTFSLQQIESVCAQVALSAVHRSFYVQALDMSSHLWRGLLEASWVEEYESMDFRARFWKSQYSDCFQYELLLQQKRAIVIKSEDGRQNRRSRDANQSPVGQPLLATVSTLVPGKMVDEGNQQDVAINSIPRCEQVPEFRVDQYYQDGVSFGRLFNSVLYSLAMCKLNLLYGRILAHPSFQKALADQLVKIELSSYYLNIDVIGGVSISFSVNAQNGDFSFHIHTYTNDYGLKNMCPSIESGLHIFLVEINNLEFQDQMRSILREYGIQFVRDDLNERLQSNPSDANKKVVMQQKDASSEQKDEVDYTAFDLKYMRPFTTTNVLLANLFLASWEVKAYEQRDVYATAGISPEMSLSKTFQPVQSNNTIDIPKILNENCRTNLLPGSLLVANGITNPHMELLLGRYTSVNGPFATGMDPICLSSAPAAKLPLKTLLKDYDNLTALGRSKSKPSTADQDSKINNNNIRNNNDNNNESASSLLQSTKRSDYDGTHAFYFDRGVSDVGLFLILNFQVATLSLTAHLWLCELSVPDKKRVNAATESANSDAITTTKKKKGKKEKPLTVGQMRALEEKKMMEMKEKEERESKEREDDGMEQEAVDDSAAVVRVEEAAPRATVSVMRTHSIPTEVPLFSQASTTAKKTKKKSSASSSQEALDTLIFDLSSLELIVAEVNEMKQRWFQEPLLLSDYVTPRPIGKNDSNNSHPSVKISVCREGGVQTGETVQIECLLGTDNSSAKKKKKKDEDMSIGNVSFSFFHTRATDNNSSGNKNSSTATVSLYFRQLDVPTLESTNHAAIMTVYFRHIVSTLLELPVNDSSAKSKDLQRVMDGQVSWKSNAIAKEMKTLLVKVMVLSHALMKFSYLAEAQSTLDLSQAAKSSNVTNCDDAVRDPKTNQFQLQVNTYNKPIEVQYLKCIEVDEEDGSLLYLPVVNSLYDNGSAVSMADNRYGHLVRVKISEGAVLCVTDAMNANSDFEEIVVAEDGDLTGIDCFRALVGRIVSQAL